MGPQQRKIIVHTSYITSCSDFFATALKEEWLEGQTRTVTLPNEDRELMAHYVDYLYTQKLPTRDYRPSLFGTTPSGQLACLVLAQLYVLGERILDKSFRNAVIEEVVRIYSRPMTDMVNVVYQGTVAGSPARRLMVDLNFSKCNSQSAFLHTADVDKALLFDLAQALSTAVSNPLGIYGSRKRDPKAADYYVSA